MSNAVRRQQAARQGGDLSADLRPEIAERVLRYFRENSEAMDSVEGIARFWVHEDRSLVERILSELHERGFLAKRAIAGTDFYSLQRESGRPPEASPSAASATAPSVPVIAATATPAVATAVPVDGSAEGSRLDPDFVPVPQLPLEARGRILMVDDDPSVRKFMVEALGETGHTVLSAENGAQALELFRSQPFDLVVTDLMMPGMSGVDLLQVIKRESPATEVMVVTAHATLEAAINALRHGAYDLITKPLTDIDSLHRVVGRALERRRLSTENRLLVDNLQARNRELKETVARLAAVNEIGKATTGLLNISELYESLVRLVAQQLRVRRVSVLLSEGDADTMRVVASVGITDHDVLSRPVRVGEGIAGHVAATQAPLLVPDIEKSELKRLRKGGKYTTSSFMITPIMVSYPIRFQRRRIGVINVSDKLSGDPFTEQDLEFLSTLSAQVAVAIENARLVKEMEGGYLGALVALIRGIEDSRPESRGHSMRVAELAAEVAFAMKLPEPRVELLLQAAALHEIGRLASRPEHGGRGRDRGKDRDKDKDDDRMWTPDDVMAAERILAPIASLRSAREVILHSADWFDSAPVPFGSGRPGIPVESRILGVCEDFVRLAPANGRDPEATQRALQALQKRAGKRHDPEVVAALLRVIEEHGAGKGGTR
jgi:response regulator RpfG family c-di-GMP phosphodiesterase